MTNQVLQCAPRVALVTLLEMKVICLSQFNVGFDFTNYYFKGLYFFVFIGHYIHLKLLNYSIDYITIVINIHKF